MSSFKNPQSPAPETEASKRFSDIPSTFNRRQYNDWKCLCPRRYIVSLMHFILLVIQAWRYINVSFTLAHVLILGEADAKIRYYSIGHWTIKELDNYKTATLVAEVFTHLPAALLIFTFSSYKYFLISVPLSSILHMLTPVALNHHTISLLFVMLAQDIITAPTYTAIMTTWKDWAPPAERTKLLTFSLYGLFMGAVAATFYPFIFHYVTTVYSYYLSGIAGPIWALFWFNIISDTPQNDPLISEGELVYLETNIPSDHLHIIKVKDIPWKSIVCSKPILVLCLIWFKVACSITTLAFSGAIFSFHLGNIYNPLYFFIPFVSSFAFFIPTSAIASDCLMKKFSGKTLQIRKFFLCAGFFLQCLFMFGTTSYSEFLETIFYMISYTFFAMSLPGFITLALDLSPRYVTIIAGIIFTFYTLGFICVHYFIEETVNFLHLNSLSWLFLFDGGLSTLCMIFFSMWGDADEQLWSLTFPTNRRTNDYKSYPKPEDVDDINLVP